MVKNTTFRSEGSLVQEKKLCFGFKTTVNAGKPLNGTKRDQIGKTNGIQIPEKCP